MNAEVPQIAWPRVIESLRVSPVVGLFRPFAVAPPTSDDDEKKCIESTVPPLRVFQISHSRQLQMHEPVRTWR